ncbi:hypothetical protein DB30_07901 [Enhygromyxa salina]|uniref:Uncharacterized protein n=2 Tax=Enhygromyxa salina TaxID=215803 RepID=A0A0C1ZRQ6_9BACT|nr:hypothetical protein DB30_07901 [Enhygromyxa salina]
MVLGVLVSGCTGPSPNPNQPGNSETGKNEAPSPESSPALELAAEQAEAQAWIARYQRGEVSMTSDDPRVEYVATAHDSCEPMPATRPPGFELSYWEDPYEGMVETFYGIAAADVAGAAGGACHFEWDMLWVDAPAGACVLLGPAQLDALYAALRALEIWRIESKPTESTPHSVGHGLVVRWPGSRCELLDVHSVSEVVQRDAAAFRAALDQFRRAYDQAHQAGQPPAGPAGAD